MGLTNNKRGKARYTSDLSLKDAYREFKKEYPSISYTLFSDIYTAYIEEVTKQIIEKAADFRLYARLGDIGIRKKKIRKQLDEEGKLIYKNRPINWGATLKLWEKEYGTTNKAELKKIQGKPLVRYDNKHTAGYTLKVYWDKRTCNIPNHSKYAFRPARGFARTVNKLTREKDLDYYELKW